MVPHKNIAINELRKEQYRYNCSLYPYLNNWKKNPYTFLKARLYMEASAILVYFLIKTRIKANTITIIYALLGLAGGVLLAIPANKTILIAIFIFFLKGILDWSDGHFARIKGETSITGAILDEYGGLLGVLGLQMGLGLYVAQKSGMTIFYYLTLLIPLFYAARVTTFGYNILFNKCLKSEKLKEFKSKNKDEKPNKIFEKRYRAVYNRIKNLLDNRARTVDFVCFLILLEILKPIFVTWIIFLGFVVREFLIFSVSFYIMAKGDWPEQKIRDLSI